MQDSDTSSLFTPLKADSVASLLKGQARRRYQDNDTDSSGVEQPRKPRPKIKTVASSSRVRPTTEARQKESEKTTKVGRKLKGDSDKDSVEAVSVGSHGEQSEKSATKSDSNNSENSKAVSDSTSPSSGGYQASAEPSSSGEVCSLQDDVGVNIAVSNASHVTVSSNAIATQATDSVKPNSAHRDGALSSSTVSQLKERVRLELQQTNTGSDEQNKSSAADSGFQSTSTLSHYENLNANSSSSNALDSNSKSGASSNSVAMGSTSGSLKDQSEISDMDVT